MRFRCWARGLTIAGRAPLRLFGDRGQDERRPFPRPGIIAVVRASFDDVDRGGIAQERFAFDECFMRHSVDVEKHAPPDVDRLIVVAVDGSAGHRCRQQRMDFDEHVVIRFRHGSRLSWCNRFSGF